MRGVNPAPYLELFHAHPDLDYLIVPVGGGSGAAAACLVAEGAGAASLAGLLALRETLAGSKAGIVVTGGNASPAELTTVLAGAPAAVA